MDVLAYSVDTTGFREYTLRVKDLKRGVDGPESIERVSSVAWAADDTTLFYVTDDDAKRPHRLWRRRRGEDEAVLLHEEKDERFSLAIRRSRQASMSDLYLGSMAACVDKGRTMQARENR